MMWGVIWFEMELLPWCCLKLGWSGGMQVKVWLGSNADHYYILSRFLISRMLLVTKVIFLTSIHHQQLRIGDSIHEPRVKLIVCLSASFKVGFIVGYIVTLLLTGFSEMRKLGHSG